MRLALIAALCITPLGAALADPSGCLADARALAGKVGTSAGRQTSQVVFLDGAPAREASFGCETPSTGEDVFAAYDGLRIPSVTLRFIAKAGAALTGAAPGSIEAQVRSCIVAALKPDAGEMSTVEARAVTVECHAFARDGGGGSVTIYRPR